MFCAIAVPKNKDNSKLRKKIFLVICKEQR